MKERDWTRAIAKREEEGNRCRVCAARPARLAHITGRTYDDAEPTYDRAWRKGEVSPDRVVPLCDAHHGAYDDHEFDLLPYLTIREQLQAVADLGGLELARIRLCSLGHSGRQAA